jgi:GTPase involved in cell partitioning and DNA repair
VYIEAVHRAALPGKGDAKKFFADGGGNSSRVQGRRGKTAADTVIKVPAGTCVLDGVRQLVANC